jgi:phenylpropionate dioxygenase-like ring-hydroxylating dioxygenase large terminal subunit
MPYVHDAWYVAAWSRDLEVAKPFAISILGEPIVIYRTAEGMLAGLEDRCVHRMAPLSLGRCEGEKLRCLYHGLLFAPDGRVVEIPGQDLIPATARVRRYAVVDRHDWIWVWMGDADAADETLIPPAVGPSDPDWILGHGQMDYAAEARLICDNLCDFSHLSYVHAASFGASEVWARSRPEVIALDRGVRFQRWIVGEQATRTRGEGKVDIWQWYDFLVPGVLLMSSAGYAEGTAMAADMKPPAPDRALTGQGVTFTSQAVTPMTDKTARYFYSWGPRADQGDAAMRDFLMGIALQAFTEDRIMIEAQQRVIAATPEPRVMPTSADKGVVLYNRLVERLARPEAAMKNGRDYGA